MSEFKPAARRASSVSRIDILKIRWAKCLISMAVNALICSFASSARRLRINSRYHSALSEGCSPPTMWISVIPSPSAPFTAVRISGIAISKAWASRFRAAKAQNWQESTQMFE